MRLKRTWKNVKVTVETHEFLALEAGRSILSYCPQCSAQVSMLSAEQVARLTDGGWRTIDQWVKAGKAYFTEPAIGQCLICINSLVGQASLLPSARRA